MLFKVLPQSREPNLVEPNRDTFEDWLISPLSQKLNLRWRKKMKNHEKAKSKISKKSKIVCGEATSSLWRHYACVVAGERMLLHHPLMASRGHHLNPGGNLSLSGPYGGRGGLIHDFLSNGQSSNSANSGSSSRRDHNIDYSALFVQLAGTFPTLYRCVSCHKTVSNRWHHANIHRPQKHECPVCRQIFTRSR